MGSYCPGRGRYLALGLEWFIHLLIVQRPLGRAGEHMKDLTDDSNAARPFGCIGGASTHYVDFAMSPMGAANM